MLLRELALAALLAGASSCSLYRAMESVLRQATPKSVPIDRHPLPE
jgi:hypothetical protein